MAAITISQGANLNPTTGFLPWNNNGQNFLDSMLYQADEGVLYTISNLSQIGNPYIEGLLINNQVGQYFIGDNQGEHEGNFIEIDNIGNVSNWIGAGGDFNINMQGDGDIKISSNAITTPTAYGNSGLHMRIYIEGVLYLIQLLKSAP